MSGRSAGYLGPPIVTDPSVLTASILDYLTTNVPGFTPQEGHLETWLAASLGRVVAVARDVASNVPWRIFLAYGRSLLNLPPIAAAFATIPVTFTMVDSSGYTVPAGTHVAWRVTGDQLVGFITTSDLVIPPGQTTGSATLTATTAGTAGNGLGPGAMVMVDALVSVASVAATAASAAGVDAEDDITYLNRLVSTLTTIAPRPILPADFSVLATQVAGVERALTIDGYNTADGTSGNQRMVTVVGVDALGAALTPTVKTAMQTYLQGLRELNFVVNVADPTYTPVAVNFIAKAWPGADLNLAQSAAVAAVKAFLSPAAFAGGGDSPPAWHAGETTVRYLDVATVINNTFGVAHVTTLTINGVAGDLTLPGIAPLPTAGAITGTVTA